MKSLEFLNHELIKGHILDPDNSPLSPKHQDMLDRIISASKVLDKNPNRKHAVALHLAKYPHINRSQAYMDIRLAVRMFNTLHAFPFDFWQTWLINDIVKNIERCKEIDTLDYLQIVVKEHANLLKAIGKKPTELTDPNKHEKDEFYIIVQLDTHNYKISVDEMHKLPTITVNALNKVLMSGLNIDDEEVERIFNS
jgi:hypothetical protein